MADGKVTLPLLRRMRNALLRRGVETALATALEATTNATAKSFRQVFRAAPPTTIYVRASHSDVTIIRQPGQQVELQASLRAAFGWDFIAEQDEAGVYIVARRKPIVGALSRASFTLIVPEYANLAFHLTPGSVKFANIDGKFAIPGNSDGT